jgi:hypothetical protein
VPAPLGGIAGALFQPNPAVSTVSETEPLSATTTHGFGTAVTIAAIALACIVGVGVRGLVLGRITRRRLAAGAPDDLAAVEEPALVAS